MFRNRLWHYSDSVKNVSLVFGSGQEENAMIGFSIFQKGNLEQSIFERIYLRISVWH